ALKIINTTLKDEKVLTTLRVNGWDQSNRDPKYFFNLIKTTISKITNKVRSNILQ
ncbi:hypothetical protein GE21DRAFT_1220525, partial [Neurospora crassa]